MGKTVHTKNCSLCSKSFETTDKRKRFCNRSCSASFNNKHKSVSESARKKISASVKKKFETDATYAKRVSEGLKAHYKANPSAKVNHADAVNHGIMTSKGKFVSNPKSLLEFSSRTVCKIFKRLGVGCSRCGWNEAPCDLHHIYGRKIPDANDHKHLTLLCPNCHRLFHYGKIGPNDVINLNDYIGDKWKYAYYG